MACKIYVMKYGNGEGDFTKPFSRGNGGTDFYDIDDGSLQRLAIFGPTHVLTADYTEVGRTVFFKCPPQSDEELPGEDYHKKGPVENLHIIVNVGCVIRISSQRRIPTPVWEKYECDDGKSYSEVIFQFQPEKFQFR